MNGTGTAVVFACRQFIGATSGPSPPDRQEDETKDAKAIEQEQILALMVACQHQIHPLCGSMGKDERYVHLLVLIP